MDCCSNYPDYRQHPVAGAIGGIGSGGGGPAGGGPGPGISSGTEINGSYYSHPHPSIRYQQQQQTQHPSPYRLGGPGGYNGIGPPVPPPIPPPLPSPLTAPNMYQNYERYASYPGLPSYACNGNAFGCGNLNIRDETGYYNHYGYGRIGVGGGGGGGGGGGIPGGYSYHHHRDQFDGGVFRPRGYHSYAYLLPGREYHPSSNGYQPHPGVGHHFPSHHNHHPPHPHPHSHPHPHPPPPLSHPQNSFREMYSPQLQPAPPPPIGSSEGLRCENVTNGNAFNSEITSTQSPLGSCRIPPNSVSCMNGGSSFVQGDYPPPPIGSPCSTGQHGSDGPTIAHQQQQQLAQRVSPHGIQQQQQQQQHSTGFSPIGKESKSRKPARDKDRNSRLVAKRLSDCSTPLNPLERADTPLSIHSNSYSNSPANFSPRLQNGYISSNQSSCWSQYPDSPQSGCNQNSQQQQQSQQNNSKLIRKRLHSPRPHNNNNHHHHHQSHHQRSSMTQFLAAHKNRVLECDFIPSKKSKRRTKADSIDDAMEFREEIKNITPLPGFQQAFGSTEIGRFSETFLNTPESPYELPYESEAETLSPQPWETGDSLEGPHFNLHIGASVQPVYSENQSSVDSPIDSSYFSEIRCSDY